MMDRSSGTQVLLVSLPSFQRLIDPFLSLDELTYERLMIELKEPSNSQHINKIVLDFKRTFTTTQSNLIRFYNYFQDSKTNDEVARILNTIFNVIIGITMFLCFFSLCSSMSANLMDQTKEIGVLRAMGWTKTRIKLLYFYEAFVLVIASCLLGVVIGCIVGYTMILQQVVFTGIPLTFFFPWM